MFFINDMMVFDGSECFEDLKEIIKFNDFFQQPLSIVAVYVMEVSHIYTISPLLLISWHLDDFFRFFVNKKNIWIKSKKYSFEPESNQRPKDNCYTLIPLQSSALPTELSKEILPVHLIFVYIGCSKCWFFGYLGWNSKLAQK